MQRLVAGGSLAAIGLDRINAGSVSRRNGPGSRRPSPWPPAPSSRPERAIVRGHRFHVHPRALDRLSRQVIASGATDGVGGLSAVRDRLDGHLDRAALHQVVQRFRLETDPLAA